ncbi:unnamed protein product [Prorocentrum cordatum]|uniref:Uncharacterized protein n=1 Tax=Prorocentrum cordatum TaxID=2364126 RepID=A0ABN9XIW9_9DINO|nr:unnamed protein product [Polarella glacialis]|mmetsp:Transcript_51689/g.144315  ORF Transcript_51689/g.144315 Transcript_51689/m.144315 type:complete len:220 (+) Transcript_51689:2-661(+)
MEPPPARHLLGLAARTPEALPGSPGPGGRVPGPRQIVLQRPREAEWRAADGTPRSPLVDAERAQPPSSAQAERVLNSLWSMFDFVACTRRGPGERGIDLTFVGEGRGAYKKVETLVFVGEGKGSFVPPGGEGGGPESGGLRDACPTPTCPPDTVCGLSRGEFIVRFCAVVIVVLLLLGVVCIAISIAGGGLLREPEPLAASAAAPEAASVHGRHAAERR